MAKGQKNSGREPKKPKASKTAAPAKSSAGASVRTPPPAKAGREK
jgi:hypothetical protein